MITFFLLAAALVVIVLLLLLPTLTRDHHSADRRELNVAIARSQLAELVQKQSDGELQQAEFDREKQRLERDLADAISDDQERNRENNGQWVLWPVAVVVPLLAGLVYLTVGTPKAIDPANRIAVAPPPAQQQAPQTPDMREVVVRIQERLQQDPEDATGWFMLGRAHMTLGQFSDAVPAIRRAYELTGDNPEIMVRLADAIAMDQGGSMAGEPEPLLVRALSMQPDNLQGLWLLGIAQNERGDAQSAVSTWEKLFPLLEGDPRSQQEIRQLIADASASVDSSGGSAAGGAELTVEVTLGNTAVAALPADTAVFVYAKAQEGPPMPLAVARHTLGQLPLKIQLSDADAMMPAMKLSAFDQVIVGARVSLSGNAIAEPGDFFGEVEGVPSTQSAPVRIEITDTVK
ncbi:MAG: c-type cytochrome biogenesis protein CcmI [Pseudomonadota bacterium]